MQKDPKKYWQQLCLSAAIEENPQRLVEILAELNIAMKQRRRDLAGKNREFLPIEDLPVSSLVQ